VLEIDGTLLLEVVGGADALHDPRSFTVPIREAHLDALRESLRRHVLLRGVLLPLCDAAGIGGPWDEGAAAALLDPVLLGAPTEVDIALRQGRVDRRVLIAHHASMTLLKQRRYYEAMQSATATTDWARVRRLIG